MEYFQIEIFFTSISIVFLQKIDELGHIAKLTNAAVIGMLTSEIQIN